MQAAVVERHPLDTENLIQTIQDFPSQFSHALELAFDFHVEGDFDHVIWAGMGESSWPGLLINKILEKEVQIDIWNTYDLPSWATANSLIICSSYSGNTEETLSSYARAKQLGATIAVIASGGELIEQAKADRLPFVQIPSGYQPRYATGYTFTVGLCLLQNSELISDRSTEITELGMVLQQAYSLEEGQILARKLRDQMLVLYGPHELHEALYVSKIKFNENTKTHVITNSFPELNHNEMSGFLDKKIKPHILLFQTPTQHPAISKRMALFSQILEEREVPVTPIILKGDTSLKQAFEIIQIADYLSYFLALDAEFDPSSVEIQENFKKQLKK